MNTPTESLPPSLSAAPFAHLADPSDYGYELASEVEHLLNVAGHTDLPLKSIARLLDAKLAAKEKRYVAMETACAFATQVAQNLGAGSEEMRRIHDLISAGDTP